ncbi:MAG: aminopeptidase P family protein [Acidobacteria bacterium]|nr:aminopeptidase P family protein [Acidobacteriota bacterium]
MTNLADIQSALREQGLDGWLFFDHHERDPLAYRILSFRPARHVTRRWYYYIPAQGEPARIVHRIEAGMLDALPGAKIVYSSWQTQADGLRKLLGNARRVAMQYSGRCAIPYVSMVDAGTVELVRSFGPEVISSADLIQLFEARWTDAQLESHLEAGRRVDEVRRASFAEIGRRVTAGEPVTEWDIKQFVLSSFERAGLFTDHGPIVAANANASNPHYEPTQAEHLPIHKGDLVLLDMWARLQEPADSVYYDITWTGYAGPSVPEEVSKVFGIVVGARDAAITRVQSAIAAGTPIAGYEVDDACRGHIVQHGLGEYFVHRTGHSIGRDVHGTGANMDNLETHDVRPLIPRTCFSVEPGIYLPKFGIRSEVNMYIGEKQAIVTGEIQRALVAIL